MPMNSRFQLAMLTAATEVKLCDPSHDVDLDPQRASVHEAGLFHHIAGQDQKATIKGRGGAVGLVPTHYCRVDVRYISLLLNAELVGLVGTA